MTIYKRGSIYWYKFMWKVELIRESTKQSNDKIARKIEAAHRTRLAEGMVGIREKKPFPTLGQFINERIEPWAKQKTKWTWFHSGIRPLLEFKPIAAMKLDEITGEHIDGYAGHRLADGLQPPTVNRELRVLRRILRLAVKWRELVIAPQVEMCGE